RYPAGLAAAARPRRPDGQGRAQDAALPHPPRRRPPGGQRTAAAPENRRHLALGTGDHGGLEPDRRPAATPLTTSTPPQRPPQKQTQRARRPPPTRPASRATVLPGP